MLVARVHFVFNHWEFVDVVALVLATAWYKLPVPALIIATHRVCVHPNSIATFIAWTGDVLPQIMGQIMRSNQNTLLLP